MVVRLMRLPPIPLKGLGFATQKYCAEPVAFKYHAHQHCWSKGATSSAVSHQTAKWLPQQEGEQTRKNINVLVQGLYFNLKVGSKWSVYKERSIADA